MASHGLEYDFPWRLLLVAEASEDRNAVRAQFAAASDAIHFLEAGSDEEALAQVRTQDPETILILSTDSAADTVARLQHFQALFSPGPPLLLLATSFPDLTPLGNVLVLPAEGLPPVTLVSIVHQLVTSHRLAQSSSAAAASHRQLALAREEEQAALENTKEALRQSFAQTSHDLRSPLNALLGYAELLRDELAHRNDSELLEDVQRILDVSRRLLRIVDSMTQTDADLTRLGDHPQDSSITEAALPLEPSKDLLLIIDDDHDLRSLLARYLESEGFEVRTAADGLEGLELARELRPSAITLDVEMPGMNGWEVLECLKSDSMLAHTPVVMLTGRGSERTAVQALRQGVDDYLMKGSITAPALRQTITGVLSKARLRSRQAS